jgi:hypothetical protein
MSAPFWNSSLDFLQDPNDLLFAETVALHSLVLVVGGASWTLLSTLLFGCFESQQASFWV